MRVAIRTPFRPAAMLACLVAFTTGLTALGQEAPRRLVRDDTSSTPRVRVHKVLQPLSVSQPAPPTPPSADATSSIPESIPADNSLMAEPDALGGGQSFSGGQSLGGCDACDDCCPCPCNSCG